VEEENEESQEAEVQLVEEEAITVSLQKSTSSRSKRRNTKMPLTTIKKQGLSHLQLQGKILCLKDYLLKSQFIMSRNSPLPMKNKTISSA